MSSRERITMEQLQLGFGVLEEASIHDYVVEVGRDLPLLPEPERVPENQVAHQAWLVVRPDAEPRADARGHFDRGLLRIALIAHQGPRGSWPTVDDVCRQLRLDEVLSPGRRALLVEVFARLRSG